MIEDDLTYGDEPPAIELGQRAFEIVMARKMAAGELETTWFQRHGSTPITDIPDHWPEDYRKVVERRIELIESNRYIGLIEQPEYKRRWNTEPWEAQVQRALRDWLLDRLESYFDFDGRMNDEGKPTAAAALREPALISVAQLADLARHDAQFMEAGELYKGDPAFDVQALVQELVESESVPLLPVLRYKAPGLRKRAQWQKTWDLQRREDELAEQRKAAQKAIKEAEQKACEPIADKIAEHEEIQKQFKEAERYCVENHFGGMSREPSLEVDSDYLLNVQNQTDDGKRAALKAGKLRQQAEELGWEIKREKDRLIEESEAVREARKKPQTIPDDPEISVPPKYKSSDFQKGTYWRLRGKLDVPKERWVSFPHCEGNDGTLMIGWAGYDHLQLAQAVGAHYAEVQERLGGEDDPRLVPLLACLDELVPWLKQWHNDVDPQYNVPMGDYFEDFVNQEARRMGMTLEKVRDWQPPNRTGRKKKGASKKKSSQKKEAGST